VKTSQPPPTNPQKAGDGRKSGKKRETPTSLPMPSSDAGSAVAARSGVDGDGGSNATDKHERRNEKQFEFRFRTGWLCFLASLCVRRSWKTLKNFETEEEKRETPVCIYPCPVYRKPIGSFTTKLKSRDFPPCFSFLFCRQKQKAAKERQQKQTQKAKQNVKNCRTWRRVCDRDRTNV